MPLNRSQMAAIHEKDASKGMGATPKTHIGAMLKIPRPKELVTSPNPSHFWQFHGPQAPKPPKVGRKRRYYGENTI